jgi:hypothetical protein
MTAPEVLVLLHAAFPARAVCGVIAPHECEECDAISAVLSGRTWAEVPNAFAEQYSDSLPLLSADAYNAYLPVWLRAAIEAPDGEAAGMVPINLSNSPRKEGFTPSQMDAIVAVVEYVARSNIYGPDDPVNAEHVAAVRAEWRHAA